VKPILIALAFLIGASRAAASDGASSPIATDRPAVTDSSVVVPFGSLQAENGSAEAQSHGQRAIDGPESLWRLGVASKTELRLNIPNYVGQVRGVSGFGDLSIGLKEQLGPTRGFDVSLVASLSLPSGSAAISSYGYDPSVQVPWSHSLSGKWTAAGMLSAYWPTEGSRRNVTGEMTFLIDRQLTQTWDTFVEYAGDFSQYGGPRHLAHFGTAHRPTPHQQLDLHVGVGLSAAAVDHFIGVGYSFRLQTLRR
jgi:hypothetical protein